MKNAALRSPSSFASLALGAGLTDGHATVVLRPVVPGGLAAELRGAVSGIRGVGAARVVRHEGDVLELEVSTVRPIALASELRTVLRRRIVTCSALAGRFVVVLDGNAAAPQLTTPRFDHRVASDFDRAMGFDSYVPAPAPAPRRRPAASPADRSAGRGAAAAAIPRRAAGPAAGLPVPAARPAAPSPLLPALARPAAPARPLALAAGR